MIADYSVEQRLPRGRALSKAASGKSGGSEGPGGLKADLLKDSFGAFKRSYRADIGNRECRADYIILVAESQAAVLDAEAAAIGVVGHLRLRILQLALAIVVVGREAVAPAPLVVASVGDLSPELVGAGS